MYKLPECYWEQFIKIDKEGKKSGDGQAFESLVAVLLKIKYGTEWTPTKKSHDDNRDFWILLEKEHIWAECKNYQNTIAMDILAPTLVMAQVYEVDTILFFSRSAINEKAKNKILAFGEKSKKEIFFFDGEHLDTLIWNCQNQLPECYKPSSAEYLDGTQKEPVHIYFFRDAVSNARTTSDVFENYKNAELIYYNKVFGLSFIITNPFESGYTDVSINFDCENENRFYFQYLDISIIPEKQEWCSFALKEGEGRCISLNIRQIVYKPTIFLPKFHVVFKNKKTGQQLEWRSKKQQVKCKWIGHTKLIGSYYETILERSETALVNNLELSSLIIAGSSGTGKTRLLTECQNIFLKNGYSVIGLIMQEDFSSAYLLKEIISFLYEIPGKEILELLEKKLFSQENTDKIIPISSSTKAINLLKLILQKKSEQELCDIIDQYGSILYEKLSQKRNVLIVDNVQFANSAFLYFLKQYVSYSVNQQKNHSVIVCVFNQDYMTEQTSKFLYNFMHSGIRNLLSFNVKGFETENQGILFLQELIRINEDQHREFLAEIVKRVSLNPYNLYQMVQFLEENDIIRITPDRFGYIISNLKKYEILPKIADGITAVLNERFKFLEQKVDSNEILRICSILFLFDRLDNELICLFEIDGNNLKYLQEKHILQVSLTGTYFFDHDIIRNYFFSNHKQHILDAIKWIYDHNKIDKLKKYPLLYRLYQISFLKEPSVILETSENLSECYIAERLTTLFYRCLFEGHMDLLEKKIYSGISIKYIHQICTFIRQYEGSEEALRYCERAYQAIQLNVPSAMSEDMYYYRPFIHFYCDIAVELHYQEKTEILINNVINECKKVQSKDQLNLDEINVLQAIMYNRWYVSHNIDIPTAFIKSKRKKLITQSRSFIEKIEDSSKRGLIEYLNNSDEGYNYYGYIADIDQLLEIWNKCLIDIPTLVPEKTLNYYRKKVQYYLINYDYENVMDTIEEALDYLEIGEYSHEPMIFRTFFSMADIMARLQRAPEPNYFYNLKVIDDILQIQQLLNNHKLGDILLLKGVNAFYAGKKDEVYYSFRNAYEEYTLKRTSRYWIKLKLIEENIHYTFTALNMYQYEYDFTFLPAQYRNALSREDLKKHIASGTQRTSDYRLNLPLI